MPQIDCICGIFALHGIILHQGKGFVKGFSGFFLQKGKIRRNIKKLPKKRFRFLCILPVWFRRRIRRLCRREKPRSGLCETATCVSGFEVCKTAKLPARE